MIRSRLQTVALSAIAALGPVFAGCRPDGTQVARAVSPALNPKQLPSLLPIAIGKNEVTQPWIAHVNVVDLDQDGHADIVACDAKANSVVWLRQTEAGEYVETTLATDLRAPVHAEAGDLDGDGDLDVLVASMGILFPNNDRIGAVFILENDGQQHFTTRALLENTARVTDVRAADFNGDGRLDLAVGQFGYDQGEIRWMENVGPWQYVSHPLLDLSGTVNVCAADLTGDHKPDIVAVVSQQWEEIHLFTNEGAGTFSNKVIFGSTNADFGSSGISLCDLDRDGRLDVLYANGDGFDLAQPGPRTWHGVQWLQNRGNGFFACHRIGNLPGAYAPAATDIDGDGATDVLAVSCFADWNDPRAVSLMLFRNDGRMNFAPQILAHTPTHLVTLAVNNSDDPTRRLIVTGGFHVFPPYEHISRISIWRQESGP